MVVINMYDNENVERTLDQRFMTEPLLAAQAAELRELKRILIGKQNVRVLDIGIGNARLPIQLSQSDVWKNIRQYDGIDNSIHCITAAREHIQASGLEEKINCIVLDAKNLPILEKQYDLVVCTYFTPGNFYPNDFSFETDANGQLISAPNLEKNTSFQTVFRSAYQLLNPGGELILGSVYVDNPTTRQKQEEFYRNCGMTVITSKEHSFTATKEGFWSQRFTPERIKNYFDWVDPSKIEFIPLDSCQFAEMIRITM